MCRVDRGTNSPDKPRQPRKGAQANEASQEGDSRLASRRASRWASVAAFSSLSGASSKVIKVLSASGNARRISSSLRCVAACARACVCWMTNTMTSVVAAARVWKIVSNRAGNPNTALYRTHTTTAVTTLRARVGLVAHRSRACRTRLPTCRRGRPRIRLALLDSLRRMFLRVVRFVGAKALAS